MKGTLVKLALCASLLVLGSCRLGVSVFEGGDVLSSSGTRHCFEGSTCEIEITKPDFYEEFTAKPRRGYEFIRWNSGDGFLCGDSTDPVCVVSNIGLDPDSAAGDVIASDRMFYIMPVFRCYGNCPERLDPHYAALDSAIVALQDAQEVIGAYVELNGHFPADPRTFDIATYYRPVFEDEILGKLDVSFFGSGSSVRLAAGVRKGRWKEGPLDQLDLAYFSLSGSTSRAGMVWNCYPTEFPGQTYDPNDPDAIPEPFLPISCRSSYGKPFPY